MTHSLGPSPSPPHLVAHQYPGCLGWQAGLHVEGDGRGEVPAVLLELPCPLLLTTVQQPLEVGLLQ